MAPDRFPGGKGPLDPYEVLGLTPRASLEEIKRAFRSKARCFHPDSQGGSPLDAERFQAIRWAYETLLGRMAQGTLVESTDPDEDSACPPAHLPDCAFVFVELSAFEAFKGGSVEITLLDGEEFCFKCRGSGKVEGDGQRTCGDCRGRGHIALSWGKECLNMVCKRCSGTGLVNRPDCPVCKGRGRIPTRRRIRIPFPRGVCSGTILKLPGQGPYRPELGERAPLFAEVTVRFPEGWSLSGLDLHAPLVIDIWTALSGGEVHVETIEGRRSRFLPPCTEQGHHLRIPGLGWVDEDGRRGDHICEIRVSMPRGAPPPVVNNILRLLKILWPAGEPPKALPLEGRTHPDPELAS